VRGNEPHRLFKLFLGGLLVHKLQAEKNMARKKKNTKQHIFSQTRHKPLIPMPKISMLYHTLAVPHMTHALKQA
jgi:hypothetical protein